MKNRKLTHTQILMAIFKLKKKKITKDLLVISGLGPRISVTLLNLWIVTINDLINYLNRDE